MDLMWEIRVRKLHPEAIIPTKGSDRAACWDIYSLYSYNLLIGEPTLVGTGLSIEVPEGYFLDLRPRSGLSSKGITILNSPGTIDSDYRGELKVILINNSRYGYYKIGRGDRIAQIRLEKVYEIGWLEVVDLTPSIRGEEGFGSTGD